MRIKMKVLCGVLVVALFVVAAPAYAQQVNPTQEAYSITAASVRDQVTSGGDEDDSLPFTGMELGIVLAAGFALLGTGFAVRRLGRSQN